MDSNIISFGILGNLATTTLNHMHNMDSEARRVEAPIHSAIAEAKGNKDIAEKHLKEAQQELKKEEKELQRLQSQMNSASDEDKDSYRDQIAIQQQRVYEAQTEVWKIENILQTICNALSVLQSQGHRIIQEKNAFIQNMGNATDNVASRLKSFQHEMEEATIALHEAFNV